MTNSNTPLYYPEAFLSRQSYEDLITKEKLITDNFNNYYTVIAISDLSFCNYRSYAFLDSSKNIIIAHKGSEKLPPVNFSNDTEINLSILPMQFHDAMKFNNQIVKQIKKINANFDASQIHHTGHPSGGTIANIMAVVNNATTTSFNAPISYHLLADLKSHYPSEFSGNIDNLISFTDKINEIIQINDPFNNFLPAKRYLGNVIAINAPNIFDHIIDLEFKSLIISILENIPSEKLDACRMQYLLELIEYRGKAKILQQSQKKYGNNIINLFKDCLQNITNQSYGNQTLLKYLKNL